MAKFRVYEIAKKYNKDNKEILEILKANHVEVKNHMSTIGDEQIKMIENALKPKKEAKQDHNSKKQENSKRKDNKKAQNMEKKNNKKTQEVKNNKNNSRNKNNDGDKKILRKDNPQNSQKFGKNNKKNKKFNNKNQNQNQEHKKKKKTSGPGAFIKPEPVKKPEVDPNAPVKIPPVLTLKELADALSIPANDIIKKLLISGAGMLNVNSELDFEKARLKESELYYASLKKSIYDSKAYRHDLKHHFSTLKSMIYLKKYEEAYEFINSLYDKTCELSDIRSGDEFIDLVLTSRLHKIYSLNIKMYFEIRPLDLNFINYMDLNTIYANIIDNAINSCEKCKNRYIKIQTQSNNQYQIIKVINSCAYVNKVDDSFISTNKNNKEHGFGLFNIKKTAQKYNGFVQFKFNHDSQEFITIIIFKNNAKKNNSSK